MDSEEIEERTEKTLREADTYRVPIQVDKVARSLNLTMEAARLGPYLRSAGRGGRSRRDRL